MRTVFWFKLWGVRVFVAWAQFLRASVHMNLRLFGISIVLGILLGADISAHFLVSAAVTAVTIWPLLVLSHEFGHAKTACRLGIPASITMDARLALTIGIRFEEATIVDYRKHLLVAVIGPLVTLATTLALFGFGYVVGAPGTKAIIYATAVVAAGTLIFGTVQDALSARTMLTRIRQSR